MMTMTCPVCHTDIKANAADWRLPPWCPRCGASVQAGPQNVQFYSPLNHIGAQPALPLANAAPAPPPPSLHGAPQPAATEVRYFEAFQATIWNENEREHVRFYPMRNDLLVIRVRGGDNGTLDPQPGNAPGGYRWTEMLDAADEGQLREFATVAGAGFVLEPGQVEWLRLEPPSVWRRFFALPHEGLLTFSHVERGKLAYALPTLADVGRAIQWLPRLFGDACRITIGFP